MQTNNLLAQFARDNNSRLISRPCFIRVASVAKNKLQPADSWFNPSETQNH